MSAADESEDYTDRDTYQNEVSYYSGPSASSTIEDEAGSVLSTPALSALSSQSTTPSRIQKGGPKKDAAWSLVTVVQKVHLDGSTQFRVTCLNCNIEFGVWAGTPKIERVKAHTTSCYAADKPKRMVDVSIKPHTVPVMTDKEKAAFVTSISEWWYRTGTPFYKAEDPGFMNSLRLLRADCPKITRKNLAGPLLDACYDKLLTDLEQQTLSGHLCISSDGWSNTHGEPIINYMGKCSTGETYFLESVATGTTSHSAQYILTDLKRVIDKKIAKGIEVSGVTTDNTNTNKRVWKDLEEAYPWMFFQGCVCHGFHLLVKDILENSSEVMDVVEITKDIILFVFRHHKVLCELKERRSVDKVGNLEKPSATRWGRILKSLESLQKNEKFLSIMFNQPDFISQGASRADKAARLSLQTNINSEAFLTQLKLAITILTPFCLLILQFESDDKCVSEIYHAFAKLKTTIDDLPAYVSATLRETLKLKVAARWDFMYADSHGIAYILDPRFMGALMPRVERERIEDFICFTYPYRGSYPDSDTMIELGQYRTYIENINPRRLALLKDGKITMYTWWKTCIDVKAFPHLTELAYMVFSALVSASSSERNWSTFGLIQSKLRNRLGDAKTRKLVFVHCNMRELDKKRKRTPEEVEDCGSDAEFPTLSDEEEDA